MKSSNLVSTSELAEHLDDPEWAIVDCRFSLNDLTHGWNDYLLAHIPGAIYAHLDDDLSGPVIEGKTGRHPLPDPDTFCLTLGEWGIGPGVQVVAYDDSGGAFAARLWWMLRWLGYDSVAVLDGGWPHWVQGGYPTYGGMDSRAARQFHSLPRPELWVSTEAVDIMRQDPRYRVFDARTADRYRGENETIDPIAGHIPGAISAPYPENLEADGTFRSKEALRDRYETLLASVPPQQVVFYCGSGVSAAHNILAMIYAGFGEARLYVGSWSEWITDPMRPIKTGL